MNTREAIIPERNNDHREWFNGREFIKMQGNSKDEVQVLVGSYLTQWVNFMICQTPSQFAFIGVH